MVCATNSFAFKITACLHHSINQWKVHIVNGAHCQTCLPQRDSKAAKSLLLRDLVAESVKNDPTGNVRSVGGVLATANLDNREEGEMRAKKHP
jgi:hypothetical protein